MKIKELFAAFALPIGLLALCSAITIGCDNKEKVLDIEGPRGGEIEVERDRDTGAVDVDVNREEDRVLDVDTPGADVEVKRDDGGVDVDVDSN